MQTILQNWEKIAWILGVPAVAVAVAIMANFIFLRIIGRISRYSKDLPADSFTRRCGKTTRWLFILLAVRIVIPMMALPEKFSEPIDHLLSLALIASFAAILIKLTYVFDDYILQRFDVTVQDNLKARKIQTQLNVLRRIFITIVIVIALASMLMTFEKIRALGTAILASAGIVGIVVGMAAQKTIATFLAGLQIAITQPIRIDDVVIVENEWGKIEEVTLTYVVVRIWDLRRLIVPITYFIEKPFQNWTRVSADLLGTVFLYVDYTVDPEPVRTELRRLLESSKEWDKKVCVVQLTNASERTVELRALMSAADASSLFSLRCMVREKLIEFIKDKYPASLPKLRAELEKSPM
ncbi:MAG: mechanosensitive ion channel [Sedimentisphaerales bacterium]|nr:mechanosensitive ion channel [Sedimentisphaerales bacterium]